MQNGMEMLPVPLLSKSIGKHLSLVEGLQIIEFYGLLHLQTKISFIWLLQEMDQQQKRLSWVVN